MSGSRTSTGLAAAGVSAVFSHRARDVEDRDPLTAFLRAHDYFPTQPWAARAVAELVMRVDPRARSAWEPACGEGIMARGLSDYFDRLIMSDVIDYGVGGAVCDFMGAGAEPAGGPVDWIITNPPFSSGKAESFIRLARQRARRGVAMFVRLGFLESVGRFSFFSGPDRAALACPFAERVPIVLGDCVDGDRSAAAYMVAIWITDSELARDFPGETILRPIEPGQRRRLLRPSDRAFLASLRASRVARLSRHLEAA